MPGVIRAATEADALHIQAIYAPYVRDSVISFELDAPTVDDMAGRLRKSLNWLVCADGHDNVRGYAYASKHRERAAYDWSVDVSVYIDQEFHRLGLGRGLYSALFGLLRLQGYFNAYAGITLPTEGSVGLHTALGFRRVGVYERVGFKFGRWHDVLWLGLALQPLADSPSPPRALAEIIQTADARAALADGASLIRL
jgi:L-amino acid N-acyltransferase YncA